MQFFSDLYQLYESIGPNGEKIQLGSFGMQTYAANDVMANIHKDGEFSHRYGYSLHRSYNNTGLLNASRSQFSTKTKES
jgi:hypothetical protein